jgi:hypothetical protein
VDPRISIAAQIQQPFNLDLFWSHQLVHVAINTPAVNVTIPQPDPGICAAEQSLGQLHS